MSNESKREFQAGDKVLVPEGLCGTIEVIADIDPPAALVDFEIPNPESMMKGFYWLDQLKGAGDAVAGE